MVSKNSKVAFPTIVIDPEARVQITSREFSVDDHVLFILSTIASAYRWFDMVNQVESPPFFVPSQNSDVRTDVVVWVKAENADSWEWFYLIGAKIKFVSKKGQSLCSLPDIKWQLKILTSLLPFTVRENNIMNIKSIEFEIPLMDQSK